MLELIQENNVIIGIIIGIITLIPQHFDLTLFISS